MVISISENVLEEKYSAPFRIRTQDLLPLCCEPVRMSLQALFFFYQAIILALIVLTELAGTMLAWLAWTP